MMNNERISAKAIKPAVITAVTVFIAALACCVMASAATIDTISVTRDGDTLKISTNYDKTITEATILIYNGNTAIEENDILYIDQITIPDENLTSEYFTYNSASGDATYTIALDGELSDKYTVKLGGSTVTEPIVFSSEIMPVITAQPTDIYIEVGQETNLSVSATATDGMLSYRWYELKSDGTTNAQAMGADFVISESAPGTRYYYCVVTNTYRDSQGTKNASIVSDTVKVTAIDLNDYRVLTTTDLISGKTWHIPANGDKDVMIILDSDWVVEEIFADSVGAEAISWQKSRRDIVVAADSEPFVAIAKITRNGVTSYLGLEKLFGVSPGTTFDEKTWVIPQSVIDDDDVMLRLEGWTIANIFIKDDLKINEIVNGGDTLTVEKDAPDFLGIIKLVNRHGGVKYIGIELGQ